MVKETHRFETLGFQLQGVGFEIETVAEGPKVSKRERSAAEVLVRSPDWRGILAPGEAGAITGTFEALGRGRCAAGPMYLNWVKTSAHQPSFNSKSLLYVAIMVLIAGSTHASAIDNILGNLGSDLAPLLSLFGERVTTQYLSESLTWVDNFIFAIAPLGIITAVVSAIRVAGGKRLQSLIGRAKESRADVEAELMSSTSSDVCELWNGQGVVRVVGPPTILQLVYVPSGDDSDGKREIFTFKEAVGRGIYGVKSEGGEPGSDESAQNPPAYEDHLKSPPNLSANIGTRLRPSRRLLATLGVFGAILQAGVLVFAALIQYRSVLSSGDGDPIPEYAFIVISGGTLLLAVGMFLCAQIIEKSTEEKHWYPNKSNPDTEVIWIQKGGQGIGDQFFESFAKCKSNFAVMTSVRAPTPVEISALVKILRSLRILGETEKAHKTIRRVRVGLAVGASLIGFIAQFVGLRATHPYVTVAQLGVVLVMTAIRSFVRMGRDTKNAIEDSGSQANGHELDWLAKNLKKCQKWEVVAGLDNPGYQEAEGESSFNKAAVVMKTRAHLGQLSKKWDLENRTKAKSLKNAIEATMNKVYATMELEEGDSKTGELKAKAGEPKAKAGGARAKAGEPGKEEQVVEKFIWTIRVKSQFAGDNESSDWRVNLTLERKKNEDSNWAAWQINENDLEAALCLWILSIRETEGLHPRKKRRYDRLLNSEGREDYQLWIQRGNMLQKGEVSEDVCFGWAGNHQGPREKNTSYLKVNAEEDLATLCAQELYTWFMFKLATKIKDVRGETTFRTNSPTMETSLESDPQGNGGSGRLCLINSNLASIAASYNSSGLGTVESAYLCIIPALRASGTLPQESQVLSEIRTFWAGGKDVSKRLSTTLEGYKLLRNVSAKESHKLAAWLLDAGAKVNAPPEMVSERTALQAAAECGRDKTIQLLLKNGAEINANPVKTSGRTALQAAAGGGHELVVRLLLDKGADINAKPGEISGRTALQAAADGGHESIVRLLLEKGADINAEAGESQGRTALYAATKERHKSTIELLLRRGSDLEARSGGETALHAAAEKQDGIFQKFLGTKADFSAESTEAPRKTVLQVAVAHNRGRIVRLLLDKKVSTNAVLEENPELSPLQVAASSGYTKIVEVLLDANADVHATQKGQTAIFLAAEAGHTDVVRLILAGRGVGVNDSTGGQKLVYVAAEAGRIEVMKFLLGKNDVDVNDSFGGRILVHAAAEAGQVEIVKLLLEKGADARLDVAAGTGHARAVKSLLDAGANVNTPSASGLGWTALQAAAHSGYENVVELLLDAKADIHAAQGGQTAVLLAAGAGHTKVVERLLGAGADVNDSTGGQKLVHVAAEAGRVGVVKLLLGRGVDAMLDVVAEAGHVRAVKSLLDAGVDVNTPSTSGLGWTALQAAAHSGHEGVVRLLLDAKANINAAQVGQTAIFLAAAAGHADVVQLLLDVKADDNASREGKSAVSLVVAAGYADLIRLLLKAGADINATQGVASPAARAGQVDIIQSLLAAGADINDSTGGQKLVHVAAETGQMEIVELLLRKGMNIGDSTALLHIAAEAGQVEVVKFLLEKGVDAGLDVAARDGHAETVKLLLKAGVDADTSSTSGSGWTALQAAARAGNLEIAQLLLVAGADIDARPKADSGRAPLQAASEGGHSELVQMLLDSGADVNATPARTRGRTALQAAAEGGYEGLVRLLLDARADVNAPPARNWGRTALQAAAEHGCESLVELFLNARANVNASPCYIGGRTALQAAAAGGYDGLVQFLLAAGADVNARPAKDSGRTALQAAAEGGHTSTVRLLLEARADVNARTAKYSGRTALQAAAEGGHKSLMELLLEFGADANAELAYNSERTALEAATDGDHENLLAQPLPGAGDVGAEPADGSKRTVLQGGTGTSRPRTRRNFSEKRLRERTGKGAAGYVSQTKTYRAPRVLGSGGRMVD